MRILGLALLALLLAAPPTHASADETDEDPTSEDASQSEDPNNPDLASGDESEEEEDEAEDPNEPDPEDAGPVLDRDGDPLDADDLIEVSGLVFDYFIEDDSKKKQLGIEAPDRDYLISPGGAARELGEQLGKTVTLKGWAVPDDEGDLWLTVEEFDVNEEDD